MDSAWKQYEEMIQYAVQQLSRERGIDGSWRMSAAMFHEAYSPIKRVKVTLKDKGYSEILVLETRNLKSLIDGIINVHKGAYESKVRNCGEHGKVISFYQNNIRTNFRVIVEPLV
jgi:hypothetical protein